MKKTILVLFIGILIFSFVFPGFAEIDNSTINYLKNQTFDPWITMALAAAGETELDLEYLKEVTGNLATDYEKTILALTAAGYDPRNFGNTDFVAQLKSFYQQNQVGSLDLLNDDFWGILALVSAGESVTDQIIQDSKNFILNNQNEDGGWSYSIGGSSDTNDTAAAIMALLEVGTSLDDPVITKAVSYLKSSQNDDGGFPYLLGGESDSGSDAWVISTIYKLSEDPRNWSKGNKNPIDHLESLQRTDGSFKWVASEDKDYPILTAYAVIALTQNYYPPNRLYYLRIEGEDDNICDARVKATTALDIIENGAEVCEYTYLIEETSWGPYLKKINDEESYDLIGWLYFVNYKLLSIGATDYILEPGDGALWYFGEWGWKPTKLTLSSKKIDLGDDLEARVEYFEDLQWKPLSAATVYVNDMNFTTQSDGKADLIINDSGNYELYAEKSGYIRTNKVNLLVGGGISQSVSLKVEIVQPEGSPVPEIGFIIDKDQINFGSLTSGAEVSDEVLIENTGDTNIYIEGIIKGNQIFIENITLNELNWSEFSTIIDNGSEENISVGLMIPTGWIDFGMKEGELTFWAIKN